MGGTLIVGSRGEDGMDDSGAAYVFNRDHGGADQWGQSQRLSANDADPDDWFGYAVALASEGAAVIGSFHLDTDHEAAYVFTRDGDLWQQASVLLANDPNTGDRFGIAAAADGNEAVVGAQSFGASEGRVYDFEIPIVIINDIFEDGFE